MEGRDIFLSYEHTDREKASEIADCLTAEGWSVWWDHKIAPGKTWVEEIENSLKNSRCVVVLWSATSVKSRWVQREARWADRHGLLVPAYIAAVEAPFEFEDIQAANLADWDRARAGKFVELTVELRIRLGQDTAAAASEKAAAPPPPTLKAAAPPMPRAAPSSTPWATPSSTPKAAPASSPKLASPAAPMLGAPPPRPAVPAPPAANALPEEEPSVAGIIVGATLALGGLVAAYFAVRWAFRLLSAISSTAPAAAAGWIDSPGIVIVLGLLVVAAIVWSTSRFAENEIPVDVGDYCKVFVKSAITAVVLAGPYLLVFNKLIPAPITALSILICGLPLATEIAHEIDSNTVKELSEYLLVIVAIDAAFAIALHWASGFADRIVVPSVTAAVKSWCASTPSTPFIAASVCAVAIVLLSWHFADDESPFNNGEYAWVMARSGASALAISAAYVWLLFPLAPWVIEIAAVEIVLAGATVFLYAVLDSV